MKIPFTDLKNPTQEIKKEYLSAVKKLLDRGHFILTEEVAEFERAWARTIGTKYCVGVSSGSDALYLALIACGVKSGNEVITQGNAYNASVVAILRAGGIPRFADISKDTLTLDPRNIEPLINKNTRAILPVHLYGQPADMKTIMTIAKRYNLAVIEDCAQAHLAEYEGKCVGNWGDVGAFSFYPTKNLGAFGDAGCITTNNKTMYEEILARRNLGQVAKNKHLYLGFNMRLDPIHAVALTLKLKNLRKATTKRQTAARYYNECFNTSRLPIQPVKQDARGTNVYHLYVVQSLTMNRDELRTQLAELGVETAVHYPVPVYRQPFYVGPKDTCPVTDEISSCILSLPMFYGITRQQQEYVIKSLKKVILSA